MKKQTTVSKVILHLHAKFQKRHVKVVLYLPSPVSKVTTRSLLCNERMLSTRVSNVARVSVSNVLQRCCRGWVSFSAQFRTHEIHNFLFWQFSLFFMQRSSGFTFGGEWIHWRILCNTTFSVVACWALSRTCPFWFHPSLCMAQGK